MRRSGRGEIAGICVDKKKGGGIMKKIQEIDNGRGRTNRTRLFRKQERQGAGSSSSFVFFLWNITVSEEGYYLAIPSGRTKNSIPSEESRPPTTTLFSLSVSFPLLFTKRFFLILFRFLTISPFSRPPLLRQQPDASFSLPSLSLSKIFSRSTSAKDGSYTQWLRLRENRLGAGSNLK